MARSPRDIERVYSTQEVVAKLRRLADALEKDEPFRIQIAGERIRVPERAQFSIEHELDDDEEEIEFQLKWPVEPHSEVESEGESVVWVAEGFRRIMIILAPTWPLAHPLLGPTTARCHSVISLLVATTRVRPEGEKPAARSSE
jgi:amphi-Trp domain-containing protein